jgi:hypothetical protein
LSKDISKIASIWKSLKASGIIVTYDYNIAKNIGDSDMVAYLDSMRDRRGEKVEDAYIAIDSFGQAEVFSVDNKIKQVVEEELRKNGVTLRIVKVMTG